MATPCTICGRRYPSIAAAAAAEGVTRQALQSRLARHAAGGRVGAGRPPQLYRLDGILTTAAAHAARLDTDVKAVYRRIDRERENSVDKARADR